MGLNRMLGDTFRRYRRLANREHPTLADILEQAKYDKDNQANSRG